MIIPEWQPKTNYDESSIVMFEGRRRRCIEPHLSQDVFEKVKWKKMDSKRDFQKYKYAAFTSMDEKYYSHCGRAMLRSYKKYWLHSVPIYVYNEDDFLVKVNGINCLGWKLGNDYNQFQTRHRNRKVKTFAKKGFSILKAAENLDYDRIVWLDADTIAIRDVDTMLLDLVAPDDVLSTHFSVWHEQDGIEYHSCETGFFILNKRHPGFQEFINTYRDIYINDKDADLRRFYDGEVYGKTVEIMAAKGYKMMNLNPGKHKTPIGRSVIAPYVTHYKAGLKDSVDFTNIEIANNEEEI